MLFDRVGGLGRIDCWSVICGCDRCDAETYALSLGMNEVDHDVKVLDLTVHLNAFG